MKEKKESIEMWKETYEKGMKAYILPFAMKYFGAIVLLTILFVVSPGYQDPGKRLSIIATNLLIFFLVVYARTKNWYIRKNAYLDAVEKKGEEDRAKVEAEKENGMGE